MSINPKGHVTVTASDYHSLRVPACMYGAECITCGWETKKQFFSRDEAEAVAKEHREKELEKELPKPLPSNAPLAPASPAIRQSTVTGRLSSSEPSLQSPPSPSVEYDPITKRVAEILHIPESQVTSEQRAWVKTVEHGLRYGNLLENKPAAKRCHTCGFLHGAPDPFGTKCGWCGKTVDGTGEHHPTSAGESCTILPFGTWTHDYSPPATKPDPVLMAVVEAVKTYGSSNFDEEQVLPPDLPSALATLHRRGYDKGYLDGAKRQKEKDEKEHKGAISLMLDRIVASLRDYPDTQGGDQRIMAEVDRIVRMGASVNKVPISASCYPLYPNSVHMDENHALVIRCRCGQRFYCTDWTRQLNEYIHHLTGGYMELVDPADHATGQTLNRTGSIYACIHCSHGMDYHDETGCHYVYEANGVVVGTCDCKGRHREVGSGKGEVDGGNPGGAE